jgi:hypothetical protein
LVRIMSISPRSPCGVYIYRRRARVAAKSCGMGCWHRWRRSAVAVAVAAQWRWRWPAIRRVTGDVRSSASASMCSGCAEADARCAGPGRCGCVLCHARTRTRPTAGGQKSKTQNAVRSAKL